MNISVSDNYAEVSGPTLFLKSLRFRRMLVALETEKGVAKSRNNRR